MELEFDKEIDAIVRKGRAGEGASASASAQALDHLDADTISAFAENALPQKVKLLYMEHFADCSRCRKQLAFAASLNAEQPVSTATIVAPVLAAAVPWYQKLFRTPNLALAMGALVLTFGGVLGYLMLQANQRDQNATLTQITEQEQPPSGGLFDSAASNANVASPQAPSAAANAVTANAVANSAQQPSTGTAAKTGNTAGSAADISVSSPVADETAAKGQPREAKPVTMAEAAAPPPVASATSGVPVDAEKKLADDKTKEDKDSMSRQRLESRRDVPPPAAKMGPIRSGPLQNQTNNNIYQMSVTRVAGGKTFSNRDGAWYDAAYRGQATQNYRRGTDEYKKLDKGLRSVADTIGGTVVVVWKGKAYRIQ